MVSINNEVRLLYSPETVKFMEWLDENPWRILEDEKTLARLRAAANKTVAAQEISLHDE
jgi:hypothetical protein